MRLQAQLDAQMIAMHELREARRSDPRPKVLAREGKPDPRGAGAPASTKACRAKLIGRRSTTPFGEVAAKRVLTVRQKSTQSSGYSALP